jgi:hypothetical protein
MKMATRFHQPAPLPLDALLATIPSLPRPVLSRLVARMIEHIDGLDPDPDVEDSDVDRCPAGDDAVFAGAITGPGPLRGWEIGDETDAEDRRQPSILN